MEPDCDCGPRHVLTCWRVKPDGWTPDGYTGALRKPVKAPVPPPTSHLVPPGHAELPAAARRLSVAARRLGWEVQVRVAQHGGTTSVGVRMRRAGHRGCAAVWAHTETGDWTTRGCFIGYSKVASKVLKDHVYGGTSC